MEKGRCGACGGGGWGMVPEDTRENLERRERKKN